MAVGVMVRRALMLICSGLLGGCGSWSGKPAALEFPVRQSAPVDGWSAGGAVVPMTPGGDPSALVNPFDPVALNNMAVAEAARGQYQQALALLQRAVKLAPARADIATNLANMKRWLAQVEGQAALGIAPQPLQLPYQETSTIPVPQLWRSPQPLPAAEVPRQEPVRPARSANPVSPLPSSPWAPAGR